jgi:N-acetylmuramoyl-L-alanine amidase
MKKIWQWIVIIPILIGIGFSIWITMKNHIALNDDKQKKENVFGIAMTKSAEVTKFYTYGTSLNIEGKIAGIAKDNYEGIRIIVTDGAEYNQEYKADISFEENNLIFSTAYKMNDAINLDALEAGNKYYIMVRLKVNNSKNYRYYLLNNLSEYSDIEYYTLTKNEKNNKINIKFDTENYNDKKYAYLGISVEECTLPEDIYDFVIDSGHGGQDKGNSSNGINEADLMLDYAKKLKTLLEDKGYKVKLTRDDSNSEMYTYYNMYDEEGRITVACKTKAKYMLSLHTDDDGSSGVQVYAPGNCNLDLAKKIATQICEHSNLEYSGLTSYKEDDGVYIRNFRKTDIEARSESAKANGLEPYNITTDTPYLYTIREVGGIATNAYVDGRDTNYSKNIYYNSNQGIECYQISIGSISKELEILQNEEEAILNAIASAF